MDAALAGLIIRRHRLARGWNQSGLCRGICAVSYLSKLEQGKAEPAPEIIRLLFDRLGIRWQDGADARRAQSLEESLFDAVLSGEDTDALEKQLREALDNLLCGPRMLSFLLFRDWFDGAASDELKDYASLLDARQRLLFLALTDETERLAAVYPCAFACFQMGLAHYNGGRYAPALENLRRGYDLAAENGQARLMLSCRLIMGNCYSNLGDADSMRAHYAVAERLARLTGQDDILAVIRYNIASTDWELGRVEEAYAYFAGLENPNVMALHKLAVCCETLNRPAEALNALDRAETAPPSDISPEMEKQICALVRFRLENADYLRREEYGRMLLSAFDAMRESLPSGYAAFHLRWITEWHAAHRQYRQIARLLTDFPGNHISI